MVVKSKLQQQLLKSSDVVDRFIYLDRRERLSKQFAVIGEIAQGKFDLAITAHYIHPVFAPIMHVLSGAKYRVGERELLGNLLYNVKVRTQGKTHKVQSNIRIAKEMGIATSKHDNIKIDSSDEDHVWAQDFLSRNGASNEAFLIGIHAGSGTLESHKRWPGERFSHLIERIKAKYGFPVILFGGPDEGALVEGIIEESGCFVINASSKLQLRQTIALIQRCELMIGGDSGLMHVAAAVDTHTISIFGPTDPTLTRPFSPKNVVLKGRMECTPCYRRRYLTGCGDPECMRLVTVDDVFSVFESYLNGQHKAI